MNPLLLGVLKKAPELIVIAKKLADSIRAGKQTAAVADRVATLEQNEMQQAELVKEMTRQLNDMTAVLRVLSSRLAICLTCSVIALVLAGAALLSSKAG
jgi:hypothetical protein